MRLVEDDVVHGGAEQDEESREHEKGPVTAGNERPDDPDHDEHAFAQEKQLVVEMRLRDELDGSANVISTLAPRNGHSEEGTPEKVPRDCCSSLITFMFSMAEQVRTILARLGYRSWSPPWAGLTAQNPGTRETSSQG